ncbi:MAG: PHP domain-containing protein [Ruminococcaceae bacterium]|nr:PHP domain-containing protein [Oscillospiraceae bacterium]
MRYVADHDFHIHSTVSLCCRDDNQTPQAILNYAKENGFNKICITNHFWDEKVKSEAEWIEEHDYSHISSVLPLPKDDNIEFLFGCETDMDFNNVLGVSEERFYAFDFIVVATTHLHLDGNTVRTKITNPEEAAFHWVDKLENLLLKDLPFNKIGIAHLTTGHILKNQTAETLSLISDATMCSIFSECSRKGVGIELNVKTINMTDEQKEIFLRPYFIAKECGCKFYLGSDSHKTSALATAKSDFEDLITLLNLKETDKFTL